MNGVTIPSARLAEMQHELAALRRVYEAGRSLLRFNGIDAGRVRRAMDELDTSIELVKVIDSGVGEFYAPNPHGSPLEVASDCVFGLHRAALSAIELLAPADPPADSVGGRVLDVLADAVEKFEKAFWPLDGIDDAPALNPPADPNESPSGPFSPLPGPAAKEGGDR